MTIYKFVLGFFLLGVIACKNDKQNKKQTDMTAKTEIEDFHSYSNANKIHPDHLELDLKVDFDTHQIQGTATWDIHPDEGVEEAIFDTQFMTIEKVEFEDGKEAKFELGKTDSILGTPLKIALEPDVKQVKIYYKTGKNATALQWMEPSQTFGKTAPYLYTQGESIYTRTWVPSPDGPGYRFSYDATVEVPKGLMALMSAENPQEKSDDGIYHFTMREKIPAYLMALAVGDIEFEAVDERTGVYTEPAILESARKELEDLGEMVNVAESLYGDYRWGRYDVLILPSGFPMGGMENPRLTFATPTILAGDKSLVNLIAHELAHSWSGNLVTNATWDDFWLNEGFTVYFERRITEAQYDKDYAAMLWDLGEHALKSDVEDLGENSRHTWLVEDLKGQDPEDGFTRVPYDKGAAFLLKIEQTVGRENLDEFLIKYFDEHAFESMTTDKFVAYLNKNLLDGHDDWKEEIDLENWIFAPGIPDNYPHVDNPRFEKVEGEVAKFKDGTAAETLETKDWSTHEWRHFLNELGQLNTDQMADLDKVFGFTETGNSELANAWFIHSINAGYKPAFDAMEKFLNVTGRLKFLEPTYKTLMKTEAGQKEAKRIYKASKQNYHPMALKSLDRIVK